MSAQPTPRPKRREAIWIRCHHESGAYTEHCWSCAPFWGRWPYCPDCLERLPRTDTMTNGGKAVKCGACRRLVIFAVERPAVHDSIEAYHLTKGGPA